MWRADEVLLHNRAARRNAEVRGELHREIDGGLRMVDKNGSATGRLGGEDGKQEAVEPGSAVEVDHVSRRNEPREKFGVLGGELLEPVGHFVQVVETVRARHRHHPCTGGLGVQGEAAPLADSAYFQERSLNSERGVLDIFFDCVHFFLLSFRRHGCAGGYSV